MTGEFIMKPYLMERLGMAVGKKLDRKWAAAESTVQTGFIFFRISTFNAPWVSISLS